MSRKGYSIYKRGGKGPWYVAWRDGAGKRCVEKASDSKGVAHEIGRSKVAERDRVKGGVVSDSESKAKQAGREPVARHAKAWKDQLVSGRRTAKYSSMQANRVTLLLEYASVDSLGQLTAERVQRALAKVAEEHTANTANHYRTAMGMFCRWCVKTHRLAGSPMPAVDKLKEEGETFRRYAFTADELESVYAATETRTGKSPVKGKDRAMYYRIMANTGFRRREAASLTPESFMLDDPDQPHVICEAAYSKRRKRDSQPITRDFAEVVRPWLAGRAAGKPVIDFPKWMNLERVFRADCEAAGITPGEDEVLGVHSLRRFYITSVVRAAGLAVGQDLARHSTPALTKKYSDLDMADYRKGLAGLPPAARKKEIRRAVGGD